MEQVPDDTLQQDLKQYCQMAVNLGADDAKIITTDAILIDERVRAKCMYPKCRDYGTSANCPPYAMEIDLVKKVVGNFGYAIFVMSRVSPETVTSDREEDLNERKRTQIKNHEIISKIEAAAFYDGYYLALGFAGGSCKLLFCPEEECSALVLGGRCRHPLKARSSVEAVGIDVFSMASRVGWDIYPIGKATSSSEVPYALRLGLVLIS